MSRSSTIADILGSPAMFYRSVALERDASDPAAGRSFVLTPWLERGAAEILSGMHPKSTRRAWRIIGDFGVGKSALATVAKNIQKWRFWGDFTNILFL